MLSKKDILFRDHYPQQDATERKIFKYHCPICIRYFNTVLVSSCCGNYICRFCIGDLAKKAKQIKSYHIQCSHCHASNYKLYDVAPNAPLRIYTNKNAQVDAVQAQAGGAPLETSMQSKKLIQASRVNIIHSSCTSNPKNLDDLLNMYTPDGKNI